MTSELRVGLIGYGYGGRTFHAPVISSLPELRLAKVVERGSAKSKARYPGVEVVRDVRFLYEDPDIDVIVVATPSTDHYRFVKDALSAGKHVVVEKPFAPTSEEADELIEIARREGKMLSVFHNRRWDGDFLTVQRIMSEKLLGQVTECVLRWDGFDPVARSGNWRDTEAPGAGVFYDLGVHLLDQALCLFGTPETVTADIRAQRPGASAHDYFDVALGYGDLKVVLKSSKIVREQTPRYAIYGTKGSFVKFGTDPQEACLIRGETPDRADWGAEDKRWWGKLNTSVNGLHFEGIVETVRGSYASYYRNIYEHIRLGTDLAVKPEEARLAVRLIELALLSSKEGRTLGVPKEAL